MTNRLSFGKRKVTFAWCLYDWANSAFTTLVVTFVYSTYFVETFASDPGRGAALWSRGLTTSYLLIAIFAPIAGILADRGNRRWYLIGFTLISVFMTAALAFVSPGQPNSVIIALTIFVVANVAYELGLVFYNALLPSLADKNSMGRLSGYGWGLGYAGGLACLVAAFMITIANPPLFDLSTDDGFNVRATNLLVSLWFLIFSLPIFLWLQDENHRKTSFDLKAIFFQLRNGLSHVRHSRETFQFLIARLVYNDGLVTVFAFGGIYAAGTFGFTIAEVIILGIVLNVVAGVGALIFGFIDDKIGGKRTIAISLVFLTLSTVIGAVAPDRLWFWISACGIGFFVGPNQSASRSLMARLVPKEHESEFFGFFALSGKATAFAGPLLLGLLSDAYGQRVGVASVLLFFVVGGILLWRVDEHKGIAVASGGFTT